MIRFAILAGVSTDAQATPEKQSIPDQLSYCRRQIAIHHGAETAGPYIMDGYSRTGYDSLELAMQEIPPLGDAIRAAHADQYDVLIMDNFDRLGDLGIMVGVRFKKLRKQLHSARQSGPPVPPELYDPYSSEAGDIDMFVQGLIQRYRINKIRRAWNVGVPERARQGLHPLTIPFGYRASAKGQPAQPIAAEAELLRALKDRYLQGQPIQHLVNYANDSGIPPRRAALWTRTVIKRMLHNEYYAGVTSFGTLKTVDKKRRLNPPSQLVRGNGRHTPLWDAATYQAILAETDRRASQRTRAQTHALSGLLTCSVCHTRLHRHGKLNSRYPSDLTCQKGCISIYYPIALRLVADSVIKALQGYAVAEAVTDPLAQLEAQLTAQHELRQRVQQGFEAQLYNAAEAQQRIVAIETEIDKLTRQRTRLSQSTQNRATLLELAQQDLTTLHAWLLHDDPATVNHLLTALCQTVTITPRYLMDVVWR